MSVVEEQAKELGVDAAGGAKDGGQERDTMIVSVGMLILIGFLLGGLHTDNVQHTAFKIAFISRHVS
jgi:hypothetical protein